MHSFGRADQLDRAELERLVRSINRVLDDGDDDAGSCRSGRQPRCRWWSTRFEQGFESLHRIMASLIKAW